MSQNQQTMLENLDTGLDSDAELRLNRLFVVAFVLCFAVFLAVLWLSGTLISIPDQWVINPVVQFLVNHRLVVLILPAVGVIVCYMVLRVLTREIMGTPERYLDERQKMVRDQAHRSAFKLIKVSCLLIPAMLVLTKLPSWLNPNFTTTTDASPTITQTVVHFINPARILQVDNKHGVIEWSLSPSDSSSIASVSVNLKNKLANSQQLHNSTGSVPAGTNPSLPSVLPVELALAIGLLLLCLLVVVSTLPMMVLAWKGKVR